MEQQACKKRAEALAEIYRNVQLALQSISNIMPAVENEKIKEELSRQHEGYEQFSARAQQLAKDYSIELKEPNPMKKVMMWGSIKMNTLTDNSCSHIAEMMTQGTVMGITALKATANDLPPDEDGKIAALLEDIVAMEEEYEKIWKGYL